MQAEVAGISQGVLHIHFIPVVRAVQANICPELDQSFPRLKGFDCDYSNERCYC